MGPTRLRVDLSRRVRFVLAHVAEDGPDDRADERAEDDLLPDVVGGATVAGVPGGEPDRRPVDRATEAPARDRAGRAAQGADHSGRSEVAAEGRAPAHRCA